MKKTTATTVDGYLAALPPDRRESLERVRAVIRRHLPRGYDEVVRWGMLSYEIPLERYAETYNGQPLAYAALAAQKNYSALYLMGAYALPEQERALREGFAKAGKPLDIGKSCVRFRSADDLALDVIGRVIASTPPDAFIARYEAARAGRGRTSSRKKAPSSKPPRKATARAKRPPRR